MKNDTNNSSANEESKKSKSRGEDAIKAHEKIFNKNKPEDKKTKDQEKDAEQWRNEG